MLPEAVPRLLLLDEPLAAFDASAAIVDRRPARFPLRDGAAAGAIPGRQDADPAVVETVLIAIVCLLGVLPGVLIHGLQGGVLWRVLAAVLGSCWLLASSFYFMVYLQLGGRGAAWLGLVVLAGLGAILALGLGAPRRMPQISDPLH